MGSFLLHGVKDQYETGSTLVDTNVYLPDRPSKAVGPWRHKAHRLNPLGEILCARSGVTPAEVHFALIVMITRRYEVNGGVPLSSTARMMCVVPAMRGVTVTRGLVAS